MRKILPYTLILTFTLLLGYESQAQRWKRFRQEIGFGLGASNFLGDLGGASTGEGSRFGDFQFGSTRYALQGYYRYKILERVAARASISYAQVTGDDANAGSEGRKERNLNFRSPIIEFAVTGEFYFLKENIGGAYRLKGMRGRSLQNISGFAFMGIGIFSFSPKGENPDGEWVDLADLNTEGQGLEGGPSDYSTISVAFPIGFGFKYAINREMNIGFHFGIRQTLTDYIDDVSDVYYSDPSQMDPEALLLADKRTTDFQYTGGSKRGNPDNNDTYMFGLFSINYKFKSSSRNRTRF